jgi:hypothetical protein
MKLVLSLATLLLVVSPMAMSAQEIRISGGYNGSNIREAGPEKWIGKAGYQFGADLQLGSKWFLQPGLHFQVRNLNYTLAGFDADGNAIGTDTEFRYTERALRVPIMVGFNLLDQSDDPAFNIYALGGPTALFNLSADLDNDALNVETNGSQWYLGFGGGLNISFLFVEAGYDVAMSNVFKGNDFDTNPRVNQARIQAGIRLRLAH